MSSLHYLKWLRCRSPGMRKAA